MKALLFKIDMPTSESLELMHGAPVCLDPVQQIQPSRAYYVTRPNYMAHQLSRASDSAVLVEAPTRMAATISQVPLDGGLHAPPGSPAGVAATADGIVINGRLGGIVIHSLEDIEVVDNRGAKRMADGNLVLDHEDRASSSSRKRFTREEKGKEIMEE